MSWHVDDFDPHKAAHRFSDPRLSGCKRHAKAKAMMNPDDLQKIALLLVAGSAAAICIFTMRILVAGLGG